MYIMKKMILMVAVVATVGLTSCGGADMCECVNMEEPSDACKEMEKEWKEKYKEASDEEKEKMQKEFEECAKEDKKEEEK